MAAESMDQQDHEAWVPPTGGELAIRVFGLAMAGVCAVIVLMITLGGWWAM